MSLVEWITTGGLVAVVSGVWALAYQFGGLKEKVDHVHSCVEDLKKAVFRRRK